MATPASILYLPDEVLLQVTQHITGKDTSEELRNLALAHQQFRGVVREALVKNAVIAQHGMSTYIQLLSQKPALASSITSVTWDPSCEVIETQLPATRSAYRKLVNTFWTGAKAHELLEVFDNDIKSSAPISPTTVLACLPHVKHMFIKHSIGSCDAIQRWLCDETTAHSTLDRPSMMFHDRLETLSGILDGTRLSPCAWSIFYEKLGNLKVLELPCQYLPAICVGAARHVPPNLEVLRIWSDEQSGPWAFMFSLYYILRHKTPLLRHVQLFFDLPLEDLVSAICDYQQEPVGSYVFEIDPVILLQLWDTRTQVLVETLFPNPDAPSPSQFIPTSYKPSSLGHKTQTENDRRAEAMWFK
ncbi:hypothetical protein Ptr902_05566 [Pyrenophora tritici-repentis]|nr:hypothetical protein Ptr902_05566 [Pyrenophora tritici-repentis]